VWYFSNLILLTVDFGLAREIFVRSHTLPAQVVEKTILEAFYRFYDNATSGNRTRGGMKNAFQTYISQKLATEY
jgi:Secretory pathway protein Sec39